MKRKVALLITGCVLTVAALAAIQGYFIYNTYKLHERETHYRITQQLLEIETSGKLDEINGAWMKKTAQFIELYRNKKATRADYVKLVNKTSDSLSGVMSAYIKKYGLYDGYNVSYVNYITSAVVYDESFGEDTLYKGKMKLFGNNFENSEETKASESKWTGSSSDIDTDTAHNYKYQVVTERSYSIANWEKRVLFKMAGLLVFSAALLVLVMLLFYWSIKGLITQKKIADIKTDFINNITHEFQTPLAALDIAVNTLQKKEAELSPGQHAATLAIIDRQNRRMQKLFSQVAEASVTNNIDNAQVQELGCSDVREIIQDFSTAHRNVDIDCNASEAILHMDRFHLNTILANLLDNSVKYGATIIEVHLEAKERHTVLAVKDNGTGIPAAEQKAIFEKFYRVQKGNIHTTKGLGLGLYYVKQLVQAYKGTITVTSEQGKGATFTITLPLL